VGFEDFGYEVIKKGGEALRCHLMRGMEEARAALRFDFILALEVDGRWCAERRLGQRKETTPKVGWVRVGHVGRVMLAGLAQNRKNKKGKGPMMAWAEVKSFGLKWELGSRFSFLNLNQVLSSKKSKDLKYF
jgi:hypothetical protein